MMRKEFYLYGFDKIDHKVPVYKYIFEDINKKDTLSKGFKYEFKMHQDLYHDVGDDIVTNRNLFFTLRRVIFATLPVILLLNLQG
jgi:hypothetical protein